MMSTHSRISLSLRRLGGLSAIAGLAALLIGAGSTASASTASKDALVDGLDKHAYERRIIADYDIAFGGFTVGEGQFDVGLDENAYFVAVDARGTGWTSRILKLAVSVLSQGDLTAERPYSRRFVSDSTEIEEFGRRVELDYEEAGAAPEVDAAPPYDPNDLIPVSTYHLEGTQDPVSAILMPVAVGAEPCPRKIKVFDGRRRYDLELTPVETLDTVLPDAPQGSAASLPLEERRAQAMHCELKFVPVAGYDAEHKSRIYKSSYKVHVWLAPVPGERVYFPIRLELRTPYGAGVIRMTGLREASGGTDTALLAPE